MEFMQIVNALFELKKAVPGARWDIGDDGATVIVTMPIEPEIAQALADGRQMFAPITEEVHHD